MTGSGGRAPAASVGSTLFVHAGEILTCAGPGPRRGRAMDDAGVIRNGAILVTGDRIEAVGSSGDLLALVEKRPAGRRPGRSGASTGSGFRSRLGRGSGAASGSRPASGVGAAGTSSMSPGSRSGSRTISSSRDGASSERSSGPGSGPGTGSGAGRGIGPGADSLAGSGWVGAAEYRRPIIGDTRIVELGGRVVTPGLVDPHTHGLFVGQRAYEYEMRLRGQSYVEILEAGGGILSTVKSVREASDSAMVQQCLERLRRMLCMGTTTVEVKSGYGLSVEQELRLLRMVPRLSGKGRPDLVPTFLGAHAYPPGVDRAAYVDEVAGPMLEAVARERLARFCDVFADRGAFDVAATRRILERAKALGLGLKCHADEIEALGATELAASLGATSVDHLLRVSDSGIEALAASGTVAVLLPGTALTLGHGVAPARRLIEAGVAVAIGTDCNPGTCHLESMVLVMQLACGLLRMTPQEALVAATINAAAACGVADRVGSIEPGKQADFVVHDLADYRGLVYDLGARHVTMVCKRGERYAWPWNRADGLAVAAIRTGIPRAPRPPATD